MDKTLYEQIYDIDNLYKASKKAMKGKKSKPTVAKFWLHEDEKIAKIHQLLKDRVYRFGRYEEFTINDNSVMRKISAAPFADRVVHHAIMNIIEPLFEKSFIYDTYANRKGKGTLSALKRARYYSNKYQYILKIDIKKYFPSIDHKILIEMLEKKIEKLKVKGYIRYVDDMTFFANSEEFLEDIILLAKEYLQRLRLKVHPFKTVLQLTQKPFIFLGHKVYKTHFRLTSKAINRGRKNLKKVKYEYKYSKIDTQEAKNRIFGSIGFFKMGKNSYMIDKE